MQECWFAFVSDGANVMLGTKSGVAVCLLNGMFAYYAKWISNFSDKIRPLKCAKSFPLDSAACASFELLKGELARATLHSIDENLPFTVECDTSETAVSVTLNQGDRPVAFMSRTLQSSELHYLAIEKETTAIIEAVRK